jgi:N-dimethylarginine dimethylaminohydrolase
VKEMDFEEFLVEEGFRVIKVTHEEQSDFMINFLNIGNGKIISPNKEMRAFLEKNGSKVDVKFVEFAEVTKMYGAFHCATQAIRY